MTASTVLIASDLDRTLIYSKRFVHDSKTVACVEIYDAKPISYMTFGAVARLTASAAEFHVVPATTRTVEQFNRISLPGAPYRFVVTSNGGTILVDGVPDPVWSKAVASRIRETCAPLGVVTDALLARASDTWVRNFRVAAELFCYLVVDEALLPVDFLEEWHAWCEPRGWVVSRQGRKIYSVPSTLCKSHAVAEVRRRLIGRGELAASALLLAAGDGALDAGLLQSADAAIRPAHGELCALGWTIPTLTVAKAPGASAAEEILNWFARSSVHQPSAGRRRCNRVSHGTTSRRDMC